MIIYFQTTRGLGASLLGLVSTTGERNFRGLLITYELYILVARRTALVPFPRIIESAVKNILFTFVLNVYKGYLNTFCNFTQNAAQRVVSKGKSPGVPFHRITSQYS